MSTQIETITQDKIEVSEPKKYKVIMHNDDKTTFDFVIGILVRLFAKSHQEALEITTQVHNNNYAVVGLYSKEIAEQKSQDAVTIARQNGFILFSVTYEEQ